MCIPIVRGHAPPPALPPPELPPVGHARGGSTWFRRLAISVRVAGVRRSKRKRVICAMTHADPNSSNPSAATLIGSRRLGRTRGRERPPPGATTSAQHELSWK